MGGTRYSFVPGKDAPGDCRDAEDDTGRETPLIPDPLAAVPTIRPSTGHAEGGWKGLLAEIGYGSVDAARLLDHYGFPFESLLETLSLVARVHDGERAALRELRLLWDSRDTRRG